MTLLRGLVQMAVLFTFAYGAAALVEDVRAWWHRRGGDDFQQPRSPRTYRGPAGPVAITPENEVNPTPIETPRTRYQRDEGDESDAVAEGGFCAAWPGMASIDAIKRAHPRLSDMQAYAVAVARTRQGKTA